jgi:CHAT domain-containing protein
MQYALDRWEVLYAPSASVWHAGIGREQEREAVRGTSLDPPLLMGMALPGIEQAVAEVETIGGALPGARVRLNQDATVEQFRSLAPSSGMIHLATHARFRPDNPLFSALQLADGWLLARDLYDMNLQCRLATLSACRTGLAEVEAGDELFGLVRAFLAAGATSVAASLWPVHDASTRSMMVEFHRSLARPGATRASALRCAQQSVRSEYPHPYYWAVFALVGNR